MGDSDLLKPSHARNMRLVGHCDQAGRSDGQQIMVRNGHAYIGHVCSKGFSVIDVSDPRPNRPIVLHSADVFVDKNALCYCTDFNAGLYIVEYTG